MSAAPDITAKRLKYFHGLWGEGYDAVLYMRRVRRDRRRHEVLREACYTILRIEIESGRFPKVSGACTDYPKKAQAYDHRDYRKPLKVDAVCHGCNAKRGRALPYLFLPRREHLTRSDKGVPRPHRRKGSVAPEAATSQEAAS